MALGDVRRCRRESGSDRPNGFVRNDQIGRGGSIGPRPIKLTADNLQRLAGVTLGMLFPDTDNGGQPRAPGGLRFGPNLRIRLVVVGAPLGMAAQDTSRSGTRNT